MKCIDFFSQNYGNSQICKLLQEIPIEKQLAWEREVASEHSSGPVGNEEILCRQIFSPIHYDRETNTLTSTAFDDVSNKGLSVNRWKYTSKDQIDQAAISRAENHNILNPDKPQRTFNGAVRFVCKDIRSITVRTEEDASPVRGCAVYDTADQNDRSHADICQIVKNKAHARSVRLSIRDLANKFLSECHFT